MQGANAETAARTQLSPIAGLHHVTAMASDAQKNLDFYTAVLGLRLVKRTVNFDDPGTYHLYFGDDGGTPGTILTFFPWPNARRGAVGAGETVRITLSVPPGSLPYWEQRLRAHGVAAAKDSGGAEVALQFTDADGTALALVEHAQAEATEVHAPRSADVEPAHAITGIHGVTLLERSLEGTATMLQRLGFRHVSSSGERHRFAADGEARGRFIDVLVNPDAPHGRMGAGTVHHIAFRVPDDEAQGAWRRVLSSHASVTPVQDRTYFHSIYFREPGGVLFEIATDPPGFAFDEPVETLGEGLQLPPWLESSRAQIERTLPPLTLRKSDAAVTR